MRNARPPCWLLVAAADHLDLPAAIPSLALLAARAGCHFDCYLEQQRSGELFAVSGSTVIGGRHHLAFADLCQCFDVQLLTLGDMQVFASAAARYDRPIIADADSWPELLRTLDQPLPEQALVLPRNDVRALYASPLIWSQERLAFMAESSIPSQFDTETWEPPAADLAACSLAVAESCIDQAGGVFFGDPQMLRAQLAQCCVERRVCCFAPVQRQARRDIRCAAYVENHSPIADDVAALARRCGNPVIVGRQTGDGDLLRWSKQGCCLQISDPNRPVFHQTTTVPTLWPAADEAPSWLGPDDSQLESWADEGVVLACLNWHSGEVAHDEAMVNLIEFAAASGCHMSIGVHAARYRTCPMLWEQLAVAQERGGAAGLIEPVLHSGGRGILLESACPPAALAEHIAASLAEIRSIAGTAGCPTGYYAFLDTDLASCTSIRADIHRVIADAGLQYCLSSAWPGRNRILAQDDGCVVLNHSPRVVHSASPYLRITGPDDLKPIEGGSPGWMIASLDAPVRAFGRAIWKHGHQLQALADEIDRRPKWRGASLHTIGRYARLLLKKGLLPEPGPMQDIT